MDLFGAKTVDTLVLTEEHDLEPLAIRVVVYEVSKLFVDWVIFDWNVYGNFRFKVNHIVAHCLELCLDSFQIFEQLKRCLVCLVHLRLRGNHVLSLALQLFVQLCILLISSYSCLLLFFQIGLYVTHSRKFDLLHAEFGIEQKLLIVKTYSIKAKFG